MLDALYKKGIRWDGVAGTSVGAIIGFALSYGLTPAQILELWRSLEGLKSVSKLNIPGKKWDGLFNFEPLRVLLREAVEGKEIVLPSYSCYVDFGTLEVKYESHIENPDLEDQIEAVLASCSIGGLHDPYRGLGHDGGHVEFAPVRFCLEEKLADKVDLVVTSVTERPKESWKPWKAVGLISHAWRGVEASVVEVGYNDWKPYERLPNVNVYGPKEPLKLGNFSYSRRAIEMGISRGYLDGIEQFKD